MNLGASNLLATHALYVTEATVHSHVVEVVGVIGEEKEMARVLAGQICDSILTLGIL